MEKAIIGGTGVYDIAEDVESRKIHTAYGDADVDIVKINGEKIVFLARHGKGHSVPPHLINYRANMKALKDLGVKYIYATAAVGSCNPNYTVGDVVIVNDFLDFTKSRPVTFFEGGERGVIHTDMSDPYCRNLRKLFYETAQEENLPIKGEAVYVCTEGPRFETATEIKMYQILSGDVVGMTNVPEVILAKELGMCYCTIGIITNMCTGIENNNLAKDNIKGKVGKVKSKVMNVCLKILQKQINQDNCFCNESIIKL